MGKRKCNKKDWKIYQNQKLRNSVRDRYLDTWSNATWSNGHLVERATRLNGYLVEWIFDRNDFITISFTVEVYGFLVETRSRFWDFVFLLGSYGFI